MIESFNGNAFYFIYLFFFGEEENLKIFQYDIFQFFTNIHFCNVLVLKINPDVIRIKSEFIIFNYFFLDFN